MSRTDKTFIFHCSSLRSPDSPYSPIRKWLYSSSVQSLIGEIKEFCENYSIVPFWCIFQQEIITKKNCLIIILFRCLSFFGLNISRIHISKIKQIYKQISDGELLYGIFCSLLFLFWKKVCVDIVS